MLKVCEILWLPIMDSSSPSTSTTVFKCFNKSTETFNDKFTILNLEKKPIASCQDGTATLQLDKPQIVYVQIDASNKSSDSSCIISALPQHLFTITYSINSDNAFEYSVQKTPIQTTKCCPIEAPDTTVPPPLPEGYVPPSALDNDDEKYSRAQRSEEESTSKPAATLDHQKYMTMAIQEAIIGVQRGDGGPFGAVIVETKTGKVVARAHNSVWITGDPTSHAEVTAIRHCCHKLGRLHLKGHTLYTSAYPCTMCFGACHWAHFDQVFYAAPPHLAAECGFDDSFIYNVIHNKEPHRINMIHIDHPDSKTPFLQNFDLY